jgi:hypothetical protein
MAIYGILSGPEIEAMSIEEFVTLHGITPCMGHGRWTPWTKEGSWELRGRYLHVRPLIWDEVTGTVWVKMPEGAGSQIMLVRVENLVRYKAVLQDERQGSGRPERAPRTKATAKLPNLPTTAEELLAALGL